MSMMTPMKHTATPPAFFSVIGSFRAMAATNKVKIGVMELMMEVSKVVAILMAFRKVSCVKKSPSMEAMKIFHKSLNGTFSLGMKHEMSQNRMVAPMARRLKSPIGEMRLEFDKSLQMMMLNPKMV